MVVNLNCENKQTRVYNNDWYKVTYGAAKRSSKPLWHHFKAKRAHTNHYFVRFTPIPVEHCCKNEYSGLHQPCERNCKTNCTCAYDLYSPNVQRIRESWRLTTKTNKYVSIVTTYGGVWCRKEKFSTNFDIILSQTHARTNYYFARFAQVPVKPVYTVILSCLSKTKYSCTWIK